MPIANSEASVKSKRPSDSAFKQQRLPAWQPILTAGTVLPAFFVLGIAFIPIGIGLLFFSNETKELLIDYTNCTDSDGESCRDVIANKSSSCQCQIDFILTEGFPGQVYMYYGLVNYYQNHRRYVKSRDDSQLLGKLSPQPTTDCVPFAYVTESNGNQMPIAPCGAIANSMFTDVLELSYKGKLIPLIKTGIAWDSDKNFKFRNPPHDPGKLGESFKNFAKPKAWKKHIYELDLDNDDNNGFQNEDFIVWMRTAALPTFRKPYRIINHSAEKNLRDGLPKGNYTLLVDYSYDVKAFDGQKRMILSTMSLLGGKNPFLGIAYIVVGCICLLLGIGLLFIHIRCGKSTTQIINVNPRTQWTPQ